MLKITKSVNLKGQSIIEVDSVQHVVVYMSANIEEGDGDPNVSKIIQDRELYIANKTQCRQDMSDFDDEVDTLLGGESNDK